MENFTPIASFIGGILIGLSASLLLLFNGKICGISGIVGGLLAPIKNDTQWRLFFVLGLISGGFALTVFYPEAADFSVLTPLPAVILAGLLVGYGTRLGNGCTSGHGICGLSRLSGRSLVATLSFMLAGFISVYVTQHLLWG